MSDWEKRIAELGVEVPGPLPTGGLYAPVVVDAGVAYTSGIVAVAGPPIRTAYPGCVGSDLSVEEARASARGAMLSTLAQLRSVLGDLNRIERFLKVTGYVRAASEFTELPTVLDGASNLLVEIFGDERRSARTTVGVAALPGGASVELDATVRLRD
ncbi:MAG: RidA family protein [Actinomycetota bacterium]